MKRRKHRRKNKSSHPILAGIATFLLEAVVDGVAQLVTANALESKSPSTQLIAQGVTHLAVGGGGYALGARVWPASKTPILVGSILHVIFAGGGSVYRYSQLKAAPTPPQQFSQPQ